VTGKNFVTMRLTLSSLAELGREFFFWCTHDSLPF
jgi:hypothetical protein